MISILLPLFVIIFFAPGVAFRSGYLKGDALQYPIQPNWFVELILISTLSLFIHSISFYIIDCWMGGEVLKHFLSFEVAIREFLPMSIYLFLTTISATVTGVLTRKLVLQTYLDYYLPFLRVSNQWWYLFSGRDSRKSGEITDDFDYIMLDLLVEVNNQSLIYSGILDKYYFSGDRLERLHLKKAYRSVFQYEPALTSGHQGEDEADEIKYYKAYKNTFNHRFEKIQGDSIVIPYETVRNMNISFISIDYGDLDVQADAPVVQPTLAVVRKPNQEWKEFKGMLEQKIANLETKDAIKQLSIYCEDKAKLARFKNEIIILSNDWAAIEARERQGIDDNPFAKNRVINRLLKILAAIDEIVKVKK